MSADRDCCEPLPPSGTRLPGFVHQLERIAAALEA
ncbi:hypothetical protein B1M_03212, partial [Burkholderia sp. TJI49]